MIKRVFDYVVNLVREYGDEVAVERDELLNQLRVEVPRANAFVQPGLKEELDLLRRSGLVRGNNL